MKKPKASLIISIYKNIDALRVILHALRHQSEKDIEIVVSEDGNATKVRDFIANINPNQALVHLTQEDKGFRKNKALNKAIATASAEYLIFIDGDCVPHKRFIESHIENSEKGFVCSGRRAEIGPALSRWIINKPARIHRLENPLTFVLLALPALMDKVKNYEAGLYSKSLQKTIKHKDTGILGCNFSCFKQDLVAINGFNEDYASPGIGEDSDIDWRLRQNGVKIKNIKYRQ
ncbi:glycosyltransferase, partial [Kaarinaea lacus]